MIIKLKDRKDSFLKNGNNWFYIVRETFGTEKEYTNDNILVGVPGAGKTKFMQMITAILQNGEVYIGDFKGESDFQILEVEEETSEALDNIEFYTDDFEIDIYDIDYDEFYEIQTIRNYLEYRKGTK